MTLQTFMSRLRDDIRSNHITVVPLRKKALINKVRRFLLRPWGIGWGDRARTVLATHFIPKFMYCVFDKNNQPFDYYFVLTDTRNVLIYGIEAVTRDNPIDVIDPEFILIGNDKYLVGEEIIGDIRDTLLKHSWTTERGFLTGSKFSNVQFYLTQGKWEPVGDPLSMYKQVEELWQELNTQNHMK